MKISIVVPSYNQGKYIGRTLDSILMQKDAAVEIIVIDGGSKDETVEVVSGYRRFLTFFVSERDGGQSDALAKGLAVATGDFIGWQNSDDLYVAGAFADFRRQWTEDRARGGESDVYFGNQYLIDADDRVLSGKRFGDFSLEHLQYVGWNITNQCSFFRRERLLEAGGFDASLQYAMDYDLYLRLARSGARFQWRNRYWGALRLHGETKGSLLGGIRDKEYKLLRSRYVPNYKEDVLFSHQFRGLRTKHYIRRLFWLFRTGVLFPATRDKFWPDRGVLQRALAEFRTEQAAMGERGKPSAQMNAGGGT